MVLSCALIGTGVDKYVKKTALTGYQKADSPRFFYC